MNGRYLSFLLLFLLVACVPPPAPGETLTPPPATPTADPTAAPTTEPTITPTAAATNPENGLGYGMVYPTSSSSWTEADRADVQAQLIMFRDMHVNVVVQTFSSRLIGTGREADWLIFLDEAAQTDIQVIARLWPLPEWDGGEPNLEMEAAFLEVTAGHPALLAYLGLHEPLERYNSEQMRQFYAGLKEIAPDVPVAHYMGNMALFDGSARFSGRQFTEGICDLCIVWCTPAQTQDGVTFFDETAVFDTVRDNHLLINERSPSSQLWFLGQTYALQAHRHQLRMPTPDEMFQIFDIAVAEGVDGFLWYPWLHGSYDLVLSSPGMEAQQQAVYQIYEDYLMPP